MWVQTNILSSLVSRVARDAEDIHLINLFCASNVIWKLKLK